MAVDREGSNLFSLGMNFLVEEGVISKIIGKTDNIPHDDELPRKNEREREKIGSVGRGVNARLCVQGSPY